MEEVRKINRAGKEVFCIIFNGVEYRRYPDGKHPNYYFHKWKKNGRFYHKRLHHAVYEYYKGEIPEGMHIHHIDKNPLNNDISNLMLVTPHEHGLLHEEHIEYLIEHRDQNAGFTKENWHERRKKVNDKLSHTIKKCHGCGKEFIPTNVHQKFCSQSCHHRWQYTAEENLVPAICHWCGKEFLHNKYLKQKCCSDKCAHLLAQSKRKR